MQPGKPAENGFADEAQSAVSQLTDTNYSHQGNSYSHEAGNDSVLREEQSGASPAPQEVTLVVGHEEAIPVVEQPEVDPFPYIQRVKRSDACWSAWECRSNLS